VFPWFYNPAEICVLSLPSRDQNHILRSAPLLCPWQWVI